MTIEQIAQFTEAYNKYHQLVHPCKLIPCDEECNGASFVQWLRRVTEQRARTASEQEPVSERLAKAPTASPTPTQPVGVEATLALLTFGPKPK